MALAQTTGVCLITSGKANLSVLTGDWIIRGLAATSHILTLQREVPANVFKSTFDTEYLTLQIVQAVRHSCASRIVKHRWFKSPDLPEAMEIWLISVFQCQDMWNTRWCCTRNAAAEETTAGKMRSEVHAKGFSHHYLLKGQSEGPWKGFPRHPYATELTLHQRLVTEGIMSLCVWTHEARAAGQQVQDGRENGKLDSINVPLFDLLCNFPNNIIIQIHHRGNAHGAHKHFHRVDQSIWGEA